MSKGRSEVVPGWAKRWLALGPVLAGHGLSVAGAWALLSGALVAYVLIDHSSLTRWIVLEGGVRTLVAGAAGIGAAGLMAALMGKPRVGLGAFAGLAAAGLAVSFGVIALHPGWLFSTGMGGELSTHEKAAAFGLSHPWPVVAAWVGCGAGLLAAGMWLRRLSYGRQPSEWAPVAEDDRAFAVTLQSAVLCVVVLSLVSPSVLAASRGVGVPQHVGHELLLDAKGWVSTAVASPSALHAVAIGVLVLAMVPLIEGDRSIWLRRGGQAIAVLALACASACTIAVSTSVAAVLVAGS